MSQEVELKFRIPAHRLPAVQRAVATRSARHMALAASYVDTPQQHLAGARMALRLRREGDVWVQTLKAQGASAMHRLEHNVILPGADKPCLDVARHDGTPAGAALQSLLADAGRPPLVERYATEVQRTLRVVSHRGARIELALDLGWLQAGGLRLPMAELELELLKGEPAALLDLAGRWSQRFGLVLDSRSKSERGHHLARAAAAIAGGSRDDPALLAASPPAQARPAARRSLVQALQPALANASQMAEGPWTPAHLQALRQDLRRLQSWLADGDEALAWLAALQAQLAPVRRRTDAQARAADIGATLCMAEVQALWLRLMALSLSVAGID